MLDKLRRFMAGRYGNDELNIALIILGAVLTLISSIFLRKIYGYASIAASIPYIAALVRAFSRNHEKRVKENDSFLKFAEPWIKFFRKKANQHKDTEHKYYNCPQCHRTLRVPKGRGKIKITCPYCQKEFTKKT